MCLAIEILLLYFISASGFTCVFVVMEGVCLLLWRGVCVCCYGGCVFVAMEGGGVKERTLKFYI